MAFEPQTNIRLLKGYPCDNDYHHTLWFDDKVKQHDYMTSLAKFTLYNYTYQRVNKNTIRIEKNYYECYDCNYMMFQNEHFQGKWFYAFVNNMEYINENTTEIRYEIDVMQTWMFDYELQEVFIDREHSATDVFGEHTIPEGVEFGDYQILHGETIKELDYTYGHRYVAVCTYDKDGEKNVALGRPVNGVYSGLNYHVFSTPHDVNEFLEKTSEELKEQGLIAIWDVPQLLTTGSEGQTMEVPDGLVDRRINKTMPTSLGSYTPRNNKLLCYPYNFMYVSNMQGGAISYHYEFFTSRSPIVFRFLVCMSNTPSCLLVPEHYLDGGSAPQHYGNTDQMISLTGWQSSAYATDYYKAWLAQNQTQNMINLGGQALGVAGGAVAGMMVGGPIGALIGGAIGGLTSLATSTATTINQTNIAEEKSNIASGNAGINVLQPANCVNYLFAQKCIREEYARKIDEYFDMYGYKCQRVKKPNRNVRPHWTFTKTLGSQVKGDLPSEDITKINKIYDDGITFWKNGNEVCNYKLDNRPR